MKHSLTKMPRLLWRRLPFIALYALVFYVLFFVGQRVFYHIAPASYFLDYYSVNVPATPRHFEGEPVPFTVCRHKRGNYPVRGYRIIYKLKDVVHRQNAQQVANYQINGQITQNECSDVTITPQSYKHAAGSYYFKTVLNFRVNGEDKQVTFESNTYTVEHKVLTPDELQQRILQLEKQVEELKKQLALALAPRSTALASSSRGAASTSASKGTTTITNNTTSTQNSNDKNNTDTSNTNQPTPSPSRQPTQICLPDPLSFLTAGACILN